MECNTFPLFVKHNLATRPQDFVIDENTCAQVEANAKKFRAEQAAANPPAPITVQQELNTLRRELFALQNNAHGCEIRVNNEAGNIKLFEQQINGAIAAKQQYEEAGNLLAARSWEHRIQQLETELADAQGRLTKESSYNSAAARELRNWQNVNGARLLELKKQVAAPPKEK